MSIKYLQVIFILILFCPSCISEFSSDSTENNLIKGIEKGKSKGACVIIYENGRETFFSAGYANEREKKPVNGNTQFEIGSITKSFVALLIILAEEEGLLSLDDPIRKFFPDNVKIPEGKRNEIRIKDLLVHTAGLPLFPTNIDKKNEIQSLLNYSEEDLVDFLENYNLPEEPGTIFRYSSLGYGILACILVKVYNKSLNQLCLEKITIPLGMKRTSMNFPEHPDNNYADGYRDGMILNLYRNEYSISNGFGGLRSTADDLLIYMKAQAGIINTHLYSTMKKTQEVQFKNDDEMVCLGWFNVSDCIYYAGSTRGFSSIVVMNKKANKIFVMLTNSNNVKWVSGMARKEMNY
jgi:CubicO group peptidase (beta-lactamase class C family)